VIVAKEDFCFTYYDGDASKDVAHMNRLERGCYFDIIHAQRKRGRLSLADVKKVLGKDFEACWESIEWVMEKDETDNFFIKWLEDSIQKSRAHSKKQSANVSKRYQPPTNSLPKSDLVTPLEDGDGSKDENGITEGGAGGNYKPAGIVPDMLNQFKEVFPKYLVKRDKDFPELWLIAKHIHEWLELDGKAEDRKNATAIKLRWGDVVKHIQEDKHLRKYDLAQINKYFQGITQSYSNQEDKVNGTHQQSPAKAGTSEARTNAAKNWSIGGGTKLSKGTG
jgi:hypothetical protein